LTDKCGTDLDVSFDVERAPFEGGYSLCPTIEPPAVARAVRDTADGDDPIEESSDE
jgi:hypothetical protein